VGVQQALGLTRADIEPGLAGGSFMRGGSAALDMKFGGGLPRLAPGYSG
jgi:hypothetical protein